MYPHGAASSHPALTPNLSRPRIIPIPASLPVPLHVTSSRKVHRSADGSINIIQEISFYAEGGVKSLAGKQLKEVHAHPEAEVRGSFSAETNARVFVGERLVRMLIQTTIRPNTSDSLELDEVFHFAENVEAAVVPIAFEATLESGEGQNPAAVEFDLSSPIVVTLKQRILKNPGEQYQVLQAIELRANESETRPTQELARHSTISQPTNESAQFRERIFAGTDVLRVDRDIVFVCDRPILALAERREYMPCYPTAPRRRSASLAQSTSRLSRTPGKPRSRSASRSWSEDSNNTADCRTANEDLPTATSPYSLREDPDCSVPPCNGLRTARDAVSPLSSCHSDRTSRSTRKKWTVNSVVQKADARTPERYERARTMRGLSTARNLSLSPFTNHNSDQQLKTAKNRSPNGEIHAIQTVPIQPNIELGPHGECTLVEGMDVLKAAAPADSLVRTCNEGFSPSRTRSASGCSTAHGIPTACGSVKNEASQSPPFSPPRSMPRTAESSVPSTPLRTARDGSPRLTRAPSSAALDKRRGLFGHGVRPVTTPTRSARRSPSSAVKTGIEAPSPVHTAVSRKSSEHSRKSQKESKRSGKERRPAKPRLIPLADHPSSDYSIPTATAASSSTLNTARNLFGTVPTNESVARMFSAKNRTPDVRTAREASASRVRSSRSPALGTARAPHDGPSAELEQRAAENLAGGCPRRVEDYTVEPLDKSLRIESWSEYQGKETTFGKHGVTEPCSPFRGIVTESELRNPTRPIGPNWAAPSMVRPAAAYSPALTTALCTSPKSPARAPKPRLLFSNDNDEVKTARPLSRSPYVPAREPSHEKTAPPLYSDSDEKVEGEPTRTARAHSTHDGTKTARSPAASLKTGYNASPYDKTTTTAREARTPGLKTGRGRSPYDTTTAREARSTALKTGRDRSPYGTATARSPATALVTGKSPAPVTARNYSPGPRSVYLAPQMARDNVDALADTTTAREARSPARSLNTAAARSPYEKTAREKTQASQARGLPTARGFTDRSPALLTARQSPYGKAVISPSLSSAMMSPYENSVQTARSARSPAVSSMKTAHGSPYGTATAREARSPARSLNTAAARSPYDTTTAREARSPARSLKTAAARSPYDTTTARETRSPARSLNTAAARSPFEKTARDWTQASPARGLPTARGLTDRSPAASLKTAQASPYDKQCDEHSAVTARSPYDTATAREARSPARSLKTAAARSPYDTTTAREARSTALKTGRDRSPYDTTTARSPARSLKTAAARSPYDTTTARSPADGTRTAAAYGRSPALATARNYSPGPRSVYLAPQMAADNAAPPAGDGAYTHNVVTARAVSPAPSAGFASPLRPSMTARDVTSARSPYLNTARDADNSTKSCISGGTSKSARWTARSAHSPMVATSRDFSSASPLRAARCDYAGGESGVMQALPSQSTIRRQELSGSPQQQRTAVYGGAAEQQQLATSRTQSPATRSTATTAQEARSSLHVDTGSPATRVVTGRMLSPPTLRTGRQISRGVPALSPANLKTAVELLRSASNRTPEHNTMPDSQARQEDSFSEQSQLTYQKTASGFTQKPTHSSELHTGRTPTKTDNTNSMYYSARQTTPSQRTLRRAGDDDATLRNRTPKRDFSQDADLNRAAPSPVRTAVGAATPNSNKKPHPKLDEMPKCSLKTGCQATHTPRIIPAGPDSDGQEDGRSPSSRQPKKTPEQSIRTARGPARLTPSAPYGDMRTPRTARASRASPASSLHRSPLPTSNVRTAVSPDAASYSNNSNEDVATARHEPRVRRSNWAAASTTSEEQPTVAATAKPRIIVRANQADGKIHVEVCLSFKLNTSGTIRLRGEMAPALQPRTVSVNGQQIWAQARQ